MAKPGFPLRRGLSLLLCLALLLPLWGCGGQELYERLLIHGVGVDLAEGGGYLVTVRCSAAPGQEGEELFQSQGPTVLDAMTRLSLSTGRRPFYGHNYLVVFGMACARAGLNNCLDFFVKYYNARPAVQLYLAEGRAEDILACKQEGGYVEMSRLQQLQDGEEDTGLAVRTDLLEFYNAGRRPGSSAVLPVLRAGEGKISLVSAACFSQDLPAVFLGPEETRGFLALKNRLQNGEIVLPNTSCGTVTLSLERCKTAVTVEESGQLRFLVRTEVRAGLSAIDGPQSMPGPEEYARLEARLAGLLRQDMEDALHRALREAHCDIFGFGALLSRKKPRLWAGLQNDWQRQMAACEVQIEVTGKLSRMEG